MQYEVHKVKSPFRLRLRTRIRLYLWRRRNPELARLADRIGFDIEQEFINGA